MLRTGLVDDPAHVGLVDAHAERCGRADHARTAVEESVLDAFLVRFGHGGIERLGVHVLSFEFDGEPVAFGAAVAVDDAAVLVPDRPVADELHSFARLELEGVETNVGTVETGLDHHGLSESKVFGYLRDLAGCRGRGERGHHRTGGQFLDELADAQVAGTEVVAPLEHAVGFVHRDQIDPRALREELEVVRPQPFRRDVQQTNLPAWTPA